ncbi:MAG: hypothetical protein IT579_16550 [Verrucomicrobia subdivision 3 bacterium]|nr:hypothetical protein [Limisphaerales bacterium]
MKTSSQFLRMALPGALAACLTVSPVVQAETDNFDSYTTLSELTGAGWILSQMAGATVTTTFPVGATGKALRVQSNPILGQSPAVAIWYRTAEYTNFYMAVDFVARADTNQGVALLARGTIGEDPGAATGYLLNYHVTAWGDTPTSPRQGELQISILHPPFSLNQLAIGELTLSPGGAYRLVFQGAGYHLTAQVYDLSDLTQPLLRMDADDAEATHNQGICGLLSYSRNAETGSADVTLDNYEVATYDPNLATAPALAHPVVGTPTIETRTPTNRFSNCYDPSGGISFTVRTYSTNVINASATKLRLNGEDMSGQLGLSPNSDNIAGSLPGSALRSDTIYSAQIEVQDVAGLKKSTNTFWFDTFSDAYLNSLNVKIIEAENYNYSNGVYQLDPIAVSGPNLTGDPISPPGVGYFDLHGVEGVDYHDSRTIPLPLEEQLWLGEFRQFDPVGLSQGMHPEIETTLDPWGETRYSDRVRNQYATNNMAEFVVHRTAAGEWLNYTRDFAGGNYNAFLRVASFGPTEVRLDRVTSNPALPGQTTANLGKFTIPNQFARYHYGYVPLVDNSGSPVLLNLSGITTLRLTMAGTPGQDNDKLAINYILFTPAPGTIHLLSSPTVGGPYTEELAAMVDPGSRSITAPALGTARFYRLSSGTALTIRSLSVSGGVITLKY